MHDHLEATLRAGDLAVVVDPAAGARVRSLRHRGQELLVTDGRPPFGNHSFVMAPYAGRVRDAAARWNGRALALPVADAPHAMHGSVHDRTWAQVGDRDPTGAGRAHGSWRTEVSADAWFARLVVTQHVAVTPTTVELSLEVEAPDAPAPATVGWHPWFRRHLDGHEVEVTLPEATLLRRDEAYIATTERAPVPDGPIDDTLVDLAGPVRLSWGDRLAVSVASDAAATVVFTAHPLGVCVEPQTGPPNEVNSSPRVVTPDEPLTLRSTWTITRP